MLPTVFRQTSAKVEQREEYTIAKVILFDSPVISIASATCWKGEVYWNHHVEGMFQDRML